MRERDIEAHLVQRIKALGGEAYKFTSPARRNVPDRLVLLPPVAVAGRSQEGRPPRALFVECKAPGKKPTAGQLREHERLRALGFRVEVIDSKDGVDQLVENL